jgi:hypothetical protein
MNPKWPSIKEQLLADKVASNSALEKLIKENQDFHLLQPEEADDDAGLPLWLRVYWRKNHPDLQHSTVNPGGGYPDVLYNIYARMLAHPDLSWGKQSLPSESSRRAVKKHGRKAGRP